MDILEAAFSKFGPKGGFWGPYLMLSPAILLVGLLVLGLAYIGDTSLRTLDTSTSFSRRSGHWQTTSAH